MSTQRTEQTNCPDNLSPKPFAKKPRYHLRNEHQVLDNLSHFYVLDSPAPQRAADSTAKLDKSNRSQQGGAQPQPQQASAQYLLPKQGGAKG